MADGKATIERVAGAHLTMIAYPHGRASERVASAARAQGFQFGFTGHRSPIGLRSEPLLLGRLGPPTGQPATSRFSCCARCSDEPIHHETPTIPRRIRWRWW
jgi:hypothetical protein